MSLGCTSIDHLNFRKSYGKFLLYYCYKMMNKRNLGVATLLVLIIGGAFAYIGYPNQSSSFTYQKVKYECGKKISGRSTINGFKPNDQQEFVEFCRMYEEFPGFPDLCSGDNVPEFCHGIEYRAVIDILRRDDVAKIIEKYGTTRSSVRALGHKYIHDKAYLKRILPAYSDMKIDCIIVVHSPEGTRFFIENGEKHESHDDHHYLEVPSSEFLASLNQASDADITAFWLGLH